MPNRIIKETIRTSKQIGLLDDFTFRVWAYLITYVDDYGRGSADAELLKGFLFARRKGTTEKNIEDALHKLACAGLIVLYEVDGDSFLYFPTWDKHQRVRNQLPKYPAPTIDSELPQIAASCGEPRQVAANRGELPPESNPESNPIQNPNPNPNNAFFAQIISHLNQKCGTNFRVNNKTTQGHINARLSEGFTVDDFMTVIDKKYDEWHNDAKMAKYLCPETLFGAKFEKYLNQMNAEPKTETTDEISSFDTDSFFEAALARAAGEHNG